MAEIKLLKIIIVGEFVSFIRRPRSLDSTSRADYQPPSSDKGPAPLKHQPPDNIDRIGTDLGLASRPRVARKASVYTQSHTSFSSFVPSPSTPPNKKRSGEQSLIFGAYSPKVVRTNEVARLVIIMIKALPSQQ